MTKGGGGSDRSPSSHSHSNFKHTLLRFINHQRGRKSSASHHERKRGKMAPFLPSWVRRRRFSLRHQYHLFSPNLYIKLYINTHTHTHSHSSYSKKKQTNMLQFRVSRLRRAWKQHHVRYDAQDVDGRILRLFEFTILGGLLHSRRYERKNIHVGEEVFRGTELHGVQKSRSRIVFLRSPNSCFVTPMIGHLPAPDILRHSCHVGSKILEIATTHDTRTERHIRTNVWDVDWYGTNYRVYLAEHPGDGSIRPIRVESPNANYTIIDFHDSLFYSTIKMRIL